jgi:hypothetical protein
VTISAAATGTPIPKPVATFPFVDVRTGNLSEHGNQLLSAWYNFIVGMNRITPCNASTASNVITLTPLTSSPLIEAYRDYEIYAFVADATSTGSVTGTIVPKSGTLSTVKFYKSNGASQAGAGDVVSGSSYLGVYVDSLDGGNGGIVLK